MFSKWLCKSNDFYRRCIHIFVRLHFPSLIASKLYDGHYKFVNKKIYPYLNKAFNWSKKDLNVYRPDNRISINKIIWIFWWQGYKHMPDLVYYCFKSILKNSGRHRVILITKDNVKKYSCIPNYIYHKLNDGKMTFTHFSDILRFNLLRIYGGLWIDSTVYCSSNISNNWFSSIFTSQEGYEKYHTNVSLGKWTGFLIGGFKDNDLFIFMDDFFKVYWKYNDYLIDYYLIDYALNYAYSKNIGHFKDYIRSLIPKPHMFQMLKFMNKRYNSDIYNCLTSDTSMFKLTYKKKMSKNKHTFYNVLVANNMNRS